jgi:hypothetical protein
MMFWLVLRQAIIPPPPPMKAGEIKKSINTVYANMLNFKGSYIVNKGAYINLNGLLAKLMGQRLMNNVVKLNNGHLIRGQEKRDMKPLVDLILPLKEYCDSKGILDLYYIQSPQNTSKYDPQLPAGTVDYANENYDSLLEELRERGFKTLDLREEMYNAGMDHYDWFYKTDHHWKTAAAFWATGKILEYLANQGAIEFFFDDYYSRLENFNTNFFKDSFLGSHGQRTGTKFAGVDDFTVISPKFATNISVTFPLINQTKSGDFNEVVLNEDHMKGIHYFEVISRYGGIWNYNGDERLFQNEEAPIKKKILFITDSMFTPVRAFMALQFYSVYSVFWEQGNTNLKRLLEEYKPDIIVFTRIEPAYFNRVMEGF